jgi:hypothetical protein
MAEVSSARLSLISIAFLLISQAGYGDGLFVDIAADSGLDFVHFNGMSGEATSPLGAN